MHSHPAYVRATHWQLRIRMLEFPRRPLIMGIVNVTPDSFSDGGQHFATQAAVAQGLTLAAAGAEWRDLARSGPIAAGFLPWFADAGPADARQLGRRPDPGRCAIGCHRPPGPGRFDRRRCAPACRPWPECTKPARADVPCRLTTFLILPETLELYCRAGSYPI